MDNEISYLTLFSEDASDDVAAVGSEEQGSDEEFDELIKGRYKDAYTKRTQNMINRRFKETKELESFRDRAVSRERVEAALGAAKEYEAILGEANEVKELYPSFELEAECRDPKFLSLVTAGVGVKGAYEALHHDEIVRGAMQYAADRVYEAARGGIARINDRPTENGVSSSGAIDPKRSVDSLSGSDIRKILKRVEKGEKITF